MKAGTVLMVVGLLGLMTAAASGAAELQGGNGQTAPVPQPTVSTKVTVEMTAATLGDDCGRAPTKRQKPNPKMKAERERMDSSGAGVRANRPCEPTSMQLHVNAPAGAAPTTLRVKKVELFDQSGTLVGVLASRSPTVWSDAGAYRPWDEKVAPAKSLSVSYSLSEPDWTTVTDRRNKTFVIKAVVSVGGSDQTVQRDVQVYVEVSLPPNVRT